MLLLVPGCFFSCSKDEIKPPTPDVIPDVINGVIAEINVTPIDINTPDKGSFFIYANNTIYKVDFDAAAQPASNAILIFESDTILNDLSREFGNLGTNVIAYNPVADNEIELLFDDGRQVKGSFDLNTSFGGVFSQALINQWRQPNDPGKPTQRVKDDIINLIQRYSDKDGPGPETAPQFLFAKVSKR
jgi:hypothetical protein